QFAILAMLVARKYDVPLDRCLALIVQRFRNSQRPDGRWTYNGVGEVTHPDGRVKPNMTCAGLLGIAVGFGLDNKHQGRPEDDPDVKRGLAYLSQQVGNPSGGAVKPQMEHMYYLWSVER